MPDIPHTDPAAAQSDEPDASLDDIEMDDMQENPADKPPEYSPLLQQLLGLDDEGFVDVLPSIVKRGADGSMHHHMLEAEPLAGRVAQLEAEDLMRLALTLAEPQSCGIVALFTETILGALYRLPANVMLGTFFPAARHIRGFSDRDLNTALRAWGQEHGLHPFQRRNGTNGTKPAVEVEGEAWRHDLHMTKEGDVKESAGNIAAILENHPRFQGQLWFDVVRDKPMVGDKEVTDAYVGELMIWVSQQFRMVARSKSLFRECLVSICNRRQRDLLQEYLADLPPWDETFPILKTWLSVVTGVKNDAYVQDVSRLLPVSMIARALNPGCQYRSVIILDGPENAGKSKMIRILGGEWYGELSVELSGKEAHMLLQGLWLAELDELQSFRRTDTNRIKAFITMEDDRYIPKYSNFTVSHRRRTVLVGTTNDERYFTEPTGNTRFLPVTVGPRIDLEFLATNREALLAEALDYYTKHPDDWWALSPEGEALAGRMRLQRRVLNVYEDALASWLEHYVPDGETTWQDVARRFLDLPREKWKDRSLQMQVGEAFRALGWTQRKGRIRDDHGTSRVASIWSRPDAKSTLEEGD